MLFSQCQNHEWTQKLQNLFLLSFEELSTVDELTDFLLILISFFFAEFCRYTCRFIFSARKLQSLKCDGIKLSMVDIGNLKIQDLK